ncbi:MAG: glycosyltransferase family 2 protein [Actinomycetota bacterium]
MPEHRVDRRQRLTNVVRSVLDTSSADYIVAVTMVRNERDIVSATVAHLLAQGVDLVVVADNNSTDGTAQSIDHLVDSGRVVVVSDRVEAFDQGLKLTRLSRWATANGASWVVPFDADEFYFGAPDETLRDTLLNSRHGVLCADVFEYVPSAAAIEDQHRSWSAADLVTRRSAAQALPKVVFRANYLARLSGGNHKVSHPEPTESGLRIAHLPVRNFDQMRRKYLEGARALEAAEIPSGVGRHWSKRAALSDDQLREMLRREFVGSDEVVEDPIVDW